MDTAHIKQHIHYYLSLIAIQVVGLALVLAVAPNHTLMIAIVVLITFFYTFTALLHHKLNHTLTSKIMLEYVLIAALGIRLMFLYLM
jgi:hypothetical protein